VTVEVEVLSKVTDEVVSGLSGYWTRPVQQYAQVSADDIPVNWSVDSTVMRRKPVPPGLMPCGAWSVCQAFRVDWAGLGLAGGGMIFGLWASS
jgi:hypothetical protein